MRILILGGTTEASALAQLLAGIGRVQATLSLAGRTKNPAPQPIPVRIGGFGGVDGLAAYLREQRVDVLVDATHPFAGQITRNAVAAALREGVALVGVLRPEWRPQDTDRWRLVPDMVAAAAALGPAPRRVMLTIGQQDLQPFLATPHRYLVRSVEPPAILPEGARVIAARGPFEEADERRLMQDHGIEMLVTKNSGGAATRPKLDAARALGIEVVMVERPALPPELTVVPSAEAVLVWLLLHAATRRGE